MIKMTFTKNTEMDCIDAFANEANVGHLVEDEKDKTSIIWVSINTLYVRFQFRNQETFNAVSKNIYDYIKKQGYEKLFITRRYGGENSFVELLNEKQLNEACFYYDDDNRAKMSYREDLRL
jgi:hypothetical protein